MGLSQAHLPSEHAFLVLGKGTPRFGCPRLAWLGLLLEGARGSRAFYPNWV